MSRSDRTDIAGLFLLIYLINLSDHSEKISLSRDGKKHLVLVINLSS